MLITAVQDSMQQLRFLQAAQILGAEIKKSGIHDALRDSMEVLYIRNLYLAGRCDSSVYAAKDWAKRDVYNIKPHEELYAIYLQLGDYFNAAHQLELALMRKRGDAGMVSKASFLYTYSEELEKGDRLAKLALERAEKPVDRASALTAQALLHSKRKEYIEAMKLAKEAIACDVNCADAYYVLGLCYARLGRHNMVCKPLQQAVELKGGPWCLDFYETKCGALK